MYYQGIVSPSPASAPPVHALSASAGAWERQSLGVRCRWLPRRCAVLLLLLAAAPVLWGNDDVVAVIGGESVSHDELLVAAALSLEQSEKRAAALPARGRAQPP